ncbi:MAG: type II toxin-antitoxin system RelE/ParE family toxin [Deltaproteobacteria bacterium]|nr:type II toxin-antitoxin system RelE/ParE family toxin [Deltaproteobacteria bacterium]
MARLIWTESALLDLDEIAEYIALDDPLAASRYVQKVFDRVERLEAHPNSGKRPAELPRTSYREVVVAPCRIFYRVEKNAVYILYVMRSESLLRTFLLEQRNREK